MKRKKVLGRPRLDKKHRVERRAFTLTLTVDVYSLVEKAVEIDSAYSMNRWVADKVAEAAQLVVKRGTK